MRCNHTRSFVNGRCIVCRPLPVEPPPPRESSRLMVEVCLITALTVAAIAAVMGVWR